MSADNEEFLYLVNVPHLTLDLFESLKNEIHEDGMGRIHVGPGIWLPILRQSLSAIPVMRTQGKP